MQQHPLFQQYQEALLKTETDLKTLKRKLGVSSGLRLLLFFSATASLFAWWRFDEALWLIPFIVFVSAFLGLMRFQSLVKEKKIWEENVLAHIQDELNLLQGKRAGRDTGERFSPHGHPFSRDLDVFGPLSLFIQLNRSASEGGKRNLANGLLNPTQDKTEIEQLREAHREGAQEQPWIWRFMALTRVSAMNEKEEKDLKSWMTDTRQEIAVQPLRVILILGPIIVLSLLTLWLAEIIPYQFPLFAGLLQVFLVGRNLKKIGFLHVELGKKYGKIGPVARQLSLLEKQTFRSEWLRDQSSRISNKDEQASKVLTELSRIMARFDSRLNPIGAFLFNFIFLYDLQTVKKLYQWREKYGRLFAGWLDLLFEMEAWASRSSFAFQQTSWNYPELAEQDFLFKATGLTHPLIRAEKVVGNDFYMTGKPCIHLVTGSNMSGKSTFLRALGSSLVLAQNGLPVAAQSMQFTPVFLVSSMRINDSLEDDESYFYAEIKRLKQLTGWIQEEKRPFFLLDEILRGTNSRDKHARLRGIA